MSGLLVYLYPRQSATIMDNLKRTVLQCLLVAEMVEQINLRTTTTSPDDERQSNQNQSKDHLTVVHRTRDRSLTYQLIAFDLIVDRISHQVTIANVIDLLLLVPFQCIDFLFSYRHSM